MAVQEYVKNEDFKRLVDEKLLNPFNIKHILKQRGVLPICINTDGLSALTYQHFFGSGVMSQFQEVMNFEQNNLKSTVVVISPKKEKASEGEDFLTELTDEFLNRARTVNPEYKLKNIVKTDDQLVLQCEYSKPQKGKMSIASTKIVTVDVSIKPLENDQYKVNIRHEGASESKQFVSLLEDISPADTEDQPFKIRRVTLDNLLKANKVEFFDEFGSFNHEEWKLIDIINVTVNKNEHYIDDDATEEQDKDVSTGRLSGISTAILKGDGLRNNDFVKECMSQGFIFSSMCYKFSHKTSPITVDIEISFKQTDLKVSILKSYVREDDEKDHPSILPLTSQSEYIDYFQNVAYQVYSGLLEKQKQMISES